MRRQEKGVVVADRLLLAGLSDSDLEQRLIDLGQGLYPTTPDLATRVRRQLESEVERTSLTPLVASQPTTLTPHPLSRLRREKGLAARWSVLPSLRSEAPGTRDGVPSGPGVGDEGLGAGDKGRGAREGGRAGRVGGDEGFGAGDKGTRWGKGLEQWKLGLVAALLYIAIA